MTRNVSRLFVMLMLGAGLTLLTGCGRSGVVVSTEENQLTIADRTGKNATTYQVAPETKITLDGRPAELADLDPGDPISVDVKAEGETKVATAVKAESKELAEKPAAPLDERGSPFPEELVPPLIDRENADPEEQRPEGEPAPAVDAAPKNAEVPETPSADGAERDEADFTRAFAGEVISVDQDLIVLRIGDAERAFLVNETTRIRVAGEEASLDDVRAGQPAVVTAELQQDAMLARVIEVEPTSQR